MLIEGHEVIFKEGSVGVFIQHPRDLFINGYRGYIRGSESIHYYELTNFISSYRNQIIFIVSSLELEDPEYSTEYWHRIRNKRREGAEAMEKKVKDVKEQYFDRYDNTRRYSEGIQATNV